MNSHCGKYKITGEINFIFKDSTRVEIYFLTGVAMEWERLLQLFVATIFSSLFFHFSSAEHNVMLKLRLSFSKSVMPILNENFNLYVFTRLLCFIMYFVGIPFKSFIW